MRTFDEFIEDKNLDPVVEHLTNMLMAMDVDPWEELHKRCESIHPKLGVVYLEKYNRYRDAMSKLDNGEIDEGFFGDMWNKAKNSIGGRAISGAGQAAKGAADWMGRTAQSGATNAARGMQNYVRNLNGPDKKFVDAKNAINVLQQSLESPEVQELAANDKLTMNTPQGRMSLIDFAKSMAQALNDNEQRVVDALRSQRDAARVKDPNATIPGDPRMRGTRAGATQVQPGYQAAPGAPGPSPAMGTMGATGTGP